MAAGFFGSLDFDLNKDLSVLESALRDDSFKSLLCDTLKELGNEENLKHYENELKKYEKERGVDVSLIEPSPGVAIRGYDKDAILFINIGSSDKIEQPSFDFMNGSQCSNLSCKIPHATTKAKITTLKAVSQQIKKSSLSDKLALLESKQKECQLFDVIVNDICFDSFIKKVPTFKRLLISTAVESIEKHFGIKLARVEELGAIYIGALSPCLVKTISDPAKNEKKKDEDFVSSFKTQMSLSHPSGLKEKTHDHAKTPQYKLKYINHVTMQDFCTTSRADEPRVTRPHSLALEISLPGVTKAADIDVEVVSSHFKIETKTPTYLLEITLPYEVEEEPLSAKFDISLCILRLELLVSVTKKPSVSRMTSNSTDSGIECETGYRTSSDLDNSSVSSQEDCLEQNQNVLSTSNDDKTSVNTFKRLHIPRYSVTETNVNVIFIVDSCNVLSKSVLFQFIDKKTIKIAFTTIGGGLTPLHFGCYIIVQPNSVRKNCLHHKIRANDVLFKFRKATPGIWQTITVGPTPELAESVEIGNPDSTPVDWKSVEKIKDGKEKNVADSENTTSIESDDEKPENTSEDKLRKTSECFVTSSWPRGILKNRSRSLSESYLGSYDSFATSIELDDDIMNEDEIFYNSNEKKSVRFSGIVSKQLFKANCSILGQRMKNQKKAIRKRKNLERRLSEGDNTNVNTICFEEELSEVHKSSQLNEFSNVSSTGTTTTSTDGETSESDKASQSISTNKARKRGGKGKKPSQPNKGQKGRKNRKQTARMNLSNEMIFQFDSV